MPFDGIATKCIISELQEKLIGGKIQNIYMPEKDEILFSIHTYGKNNLLVVSVNPSCSRIHLTKRKKVNPITPPNFCMFLRKHIGSGKIVDIKFHDYERIIDFIIEARNELGDLQIKRMIIELTGRNTNIIITNHQNIVLDALKHIDEEISSKRQIMPAREYSLPPSQNKILMTDFTIEHLEKFKSRLLEQALLATIKGFSPAICQEIVFTANLENKSYEQLTPLQKQSLSDSFKKIKEKVISEQYTPCLIYNNNQVKDFYPLVLTKYKKTTPMESFNETLDQYYYLKDTRERINQKQGDIRRILSKNIERCHKKIIIHEKNINNQTSLDKFKLFGELITANLYQFDKNKDKINVLNYYTNEQISIPIEKGRDASFNAQRYFKKYKKAKSAALYSNKQLVLSVRELSYLESVLHNLSTCQTPDEVDEIKEELMTTEYIKRKKSRLKKKKKAIRPPLKYISSEGYEIYVGRNNIENDYLTFTFANSRDLWLHAQKIPGSHVIIRKKDKKEEFFPDNTITEAAIIAAYHSKARNSGQIAVDYSEIKNIKRPNNAPPGFVNYFTYFSAYATSDEGTINLLKG
ncbi:MAG: NFACT family protein [Clostridiales bacterium]|nr:NFACT family protein [Clostridiales bacterium]